jgi:hypothetical protein
MTEKDKNDPVRKSYDKILEEHPEFEGVISKNSWEYIGHSDKNTVGYLQKLWVDNLVKNVNSKLWKRHGSMAKDCVGIGKNKAIIGVGAGQSFNINKNVLKKLVAADGVKSWRDRNFIIVASNHQFKPLLNMGIIPDFVVVADGSNVVMDQLTKDIPIEGQSTVLLAGLQCSHEVLKRWNRQGRDIRFYLTHSTGVPKAFREETGLDPEPHLLLQGGNVINTAWSGGLKFFQSTVFFAVGNDLAFPLQNNREKQRETYYADGDYSSNAPGTGTGRDEANVDKQWAGFTLKKRVTITNKGCPYEIDLDLVGTTYTLWVYKIWLEANVLGMARKSNLSYHYYNCSEGGIAGVICRDDSNEGQKKLENWFMMDEVCKRWHTRTLADAAVEFVQSKEAMRWGPEVISRIVPGAGILAHPS